MLIFITTNDPFEKFLSIYRDKPTDSSDDLWTPTAKRRAFRKCRRHSVYSPSPSTQFLDSRPKKRRTSQNRGPARKKTLPHKLQTNETPQKIGKKEVEAGQEGEEGTGAMEQDRWRDVNEEDAKPVQPRFRPDRPPGPQLDRTASYTPLDLFQVFFSDDVVRTLVENTNAYARQNGQSQETGWSPISSADMYSFLGLVIYMGIVRLKTLNDFWRRDKLFDMPFPASVMPGRRFLAISRTLHMNHPVAEADNECRRGTPDYDKLCKVRPLYQQILDACHAFYHPGQHISIDERMVATKARIGLKRYIPSKPTKWGFKLFVLADSACGYTLNFFVDSGRDQGGATSGKGRSYDVVMRLLDVPFLGQGYKLYVDNFYTSPALFSDLLWKQKIWACGTIRTNVAGYPKKRANDMGKGSARGTIKWLRTEDLLFVKWLDSREVTMCSTLHKAYDHDVVPRRVRGPDGHWTIQQVPVPACVKDYNKHMGGVDLSDALISYYNVLHKTRKWYKTLFFHFVDIATVNAFILHKESCRLQGQTPLTQKGFREQLIVSLVDIGSKPARLGPRTFPFPSFPPSSPVLPSSSSATLSVPGVVPGHLPSYFVEHMSDICPRYRATAGRRSCVLCKRKSPVYCRVCRKALCFTATRNCYYDWHTANGVCI